jgi:hypothetical protein
MPTSTGTKCVVLITCILGCGLLIIPYPAIREIINNNGLDTYNCSDARNFTYNGKSRGAYRATALANLTLTVASTQTELNSGTVSSLSNITNTTTNNTKLVKLRYPGITTWLPYSFNTRADTFQWFSGISETGFQCISNEEWAYTLPALPNLPLYYASCAGGVVMLCISAFICCINSARQRQARYDYIHLN